MPLVKGKSQKAIAIALNVAKKSGYKPKKKGKKYNG